VISSCFISVFLSISIF